MMSMTSRVCCDANLVVRFVTNPAAANVAELWNRWLASSIEVIAPSLFRFEVTNAIHLFGKASKLSLAGTSKLLDNALGLGLFFVDHPEIHMRALSISHELNLPAAYDAHYLALAESEGVELFTNDHRFFNVARHRFSWITLVE